MPKFVSQRSLRLLVAGVALLGVLIACGTPPSVGSPPVIQSFSAVPDEIAPGGTSTLSWLVTGGGVTVTITDGDDAVIVESAPASGSHDVTPAATTTYTLTATNADGSRTQSRTVTVQDASVAELSDVGATLVLGSSIELTWAVTGAIGIDIYAVANDDTDDVELIGDAAGNATSAIVPIPASTRQTVRIVARGGAQDDAADLAVPGNVVVSSADYDPYSSLGFTTETPVPGTLRYVLAEAEPGSIIGFAQDVSRIELRGVDLEPLADVSQDAHLIFRSDVTVSGPDSKVTLVGVSGADPSVPGTDPFTWQSRVVYVPPTVSVQLDNLVITGGTFIFNGGGVRNDGTLTLTNSEVSGNRAWNRGGGIWNTSTGTLVVQDSIIRDNRAVSEDDEVEVTFSIRDDDSEQLTVNNNGFGGALYNNGTVTISDSQIVGNEAKVSGGGIYNVGSMDVTSTVIADNDADHRNYPVFTATAGYYSLGGGVYADGSFSLNGGSFAQNVAADLGGGFFLSRSGSATLSSVPFSENDADYGGAIRHEFFTGQQDNLTLSGITYSDNTARTADPDLSFMDRGPAPSGVAALTLTDIEPGRYDPSTELAPGYRNR